MTDFYHTNGNFLCYHSDAIFHCSFPPPTKVSYEAEAPSLPLLNYLFKLIYNTFTVDHMVLIHFTIFFEFYLAYRSDFLFLYLIILIQGGPEKNGTVSIFIVLNQESLTLEIYSEIFNAY